MAAELMPGQWTEVVGVAWTDTVAAAQDRLEEVGAGFGAELWAVDCAKTPWQRRSSLAV